MPDRMPNHTDVKRAERLIQELSEAGAVLIREIESQDELTSKLQEALNEGKAAVFIPTRLKMRDYYSAPGFIYFMAKALESLNNYCVLIEPNFYGSRLVVAVAPIDSVSEKLADALSDV